MKHKLVDFNTLLSMANIVVAGLLAWAHSRTAGNPFVDASSVSLALLLCAQTQLALLLERRRRDPFVILLAFEMIFYYALRIVTLTLYPYSDVFERYPYVPADSNYALIYILIANACLYAGLFLVKARDDQVIDASSWRARAPGRVVVLLLFAIAFTYFSGSYWTPDTIPRAVSVIAEFLGANIVILMTLAFFLLFRKSLGSVFALTIGGLVLIDMAVHTLAGSRSAIVVVIQDCILVGLALRGCIRLRLRAVVWGSALLPILLLVLVASFAISTINRSNKEGTTYLDLSQAVRQASQSSAILASGPSLDIVLPPLFSRAGFFDFAAELIAHRNQYSSVINLTSYAESIIDNVLTPGFDVFDAPKISNALIFVYAQSGTPSKMRVLEAYQSDQLDMYGEFYCLFGYGSLPLLFGLAYLLKRIYVGISSGGPFRRTVKKVIVLFVFVDLLRSYGLDWVMAETLTLLVAMLIYSSVFSSRPVRPRYALSPT